MAIWTQEKSAARIAPDDILLCLTLLLGRVREMAQRIGDCYAMTRLHRAVAIGLWIAASTLHATAAEPPRELQKWLQPQKWQRDVEGPVISLGKPGEFDDQHIFAPVVAEEGGGVSLWDRGSGGR